MIDMKAYKHTVWGPDKACAEFCRATGSRHTHI